MSTWPAWLQVITHGVMLWLVSFLLLWRPWWAFCAWVGRREARRRRIENNGNYPIL